MINLGKVGVAGLRQGQNLVQTISYQEKVSFGGDALVVLVGRQDSADGQFFHLHLHILNIL
jgi:hypothetical protein